MGEKLRSALIQTTSPHQGTVAVQGIGLLQSLIFPAPETARQFCREARRRGLLAVPGEVATNSVVIRPSLMINIIDVFEIESRVRDVMKKIF